MVVIGHGRADLLSKRALTLGLVVAACECIVAICGGGVVGVCTVVAVASLANFPVALWQQRRVWRPTEKPNQPRSADLRDIVREGSANFVISIAGTVAFTSDTIILGAVAPLTAVAAYTLAAKLPALIRMLSSRAIDLLQPTYSHFASATAADSKDRLLRVLSRATRFSCAIAFGMGIGACTSGKLFLHLWLGDTPDKTYTVLVLLTIGTLFQMFGHAIYVFLTGIRDLRRLLIFSLVSATANVILSVIFSKHLGAPGPAVGSLICVSIGDLFVLPAITAAAFGVRPIEMAKRLLPSPLLPLLPAVGIVFAFHVSPRSLWSLPVGVLASAVYLLGFWILTGPDDRRYVINTARGLFRRTASRTTAG
jgi:O-antigen/teichoic acid export membrane protein